MQYNKREFQKISDKKILRKVKKTWVVVSMSSFFLLGSAYLSNHVLASADTVSSTNEKEHVDDRNTSSTKTVFIQNVVDKDANAVKATTGSNNAADANTVKATTESSNATDSNAGNTATGSSNAADANAVKATTGSSNATDSNAVKATTGSSNATDSNAVKATTGSSNATDSNAVKATTGSSNATDSNAVKATTGSSNATDSNAVKATTGSSNATDSNAVKATTGSSNATDSNAVKATTGSNNSADVNGLKDANGNNSLINNDDPNKGPIQGNPSTFLKHFILSGGATYDSNSGTVTLTQDKSNQVGSFTLNSKINVHQDFNFSGQAYLGNKTDIYGGADGIGVAFQPNNVGTIGDYGANLGIGGLKNAVGFKLDTYYNRYESTDDWRQSNGNDSSVLGWEQDPTNNPNVQPLMGSGTPFGSFVTTDNNGWLSADKNSVQYLDTNKVLNTSATLLPFSIDFSSANNTMTVKFGNQVWTRGNIFTNPNDSMALSVSASTGLFHNLQQVTFNHFSFGEAASVNVEYVDDSGHSIATNHAVTYPDGGYKNKEYDTTQLSIPGYTFEKMGDNSLPAKGTLNNWGNNGSVIYVYKNITDNITPNNPGYPGKPIHPDDPNSPKWPSGSDIDSLVSTSNNVINYVDNNGVTLSPSVNNSVTFTRSATVDEGSGIVNYGNWSPDPNSCSFSTSSPVINGYVLHDSGQFIIIQNAGPYLGSSTNVVYTKLGSLVPTDSQGNVIDGGQYNTQYPNNQNNPSAINNPVLPEIPGKTPIDGQGHTLQPGNPYPVSSTDLSKNTTVVYVDSNQTAKVSYVDQTTGTTLEDKELTGLPNSTSAYRTADTIKKYTDAGYELVKDNYPATGVQFGHDNKEQDYEVTLKHVEVPVSPEHSGQPGQAINPDNPNGPKWPAGTDVNSLQKNVRETINYVDESGKSVHTAATQNITFTRNASVDEVTGKVSYGGWNQNSASFSNEASPVVNGYVLKDHSQVMITGTKVTPESSDVNVDVVYTKLGSLVPTDSQGNIIDGGQYNTQYPNNQNNPSAINNPVLPEIPGKTPIDGQGHTLQPGNPYPVSSTDLSKNTTVVYVDSNQTAKVSYVDQTTGTTLEDKELTGLPNSTSAYRTADTIKKYTDAGYELVKDNYPATGVQFGHDNKEQDYEVTLKHVEVPVSPEHSGQPGQAINPDNPNGPKWPAGTDVNSLQKNVRETINYVDESGKSVHTAATQNITFTRNASVDEVTGKVSYGGWNQNSASFSNEASPVVNGYVLKDHSQVMITGTKVTPESSDVNVDVVYTKLGSLVPTDSQGNVIDGGQYNTQYPNNQNNPSAINNPVLPEIPGKTPIDGQGHTLQPGNPYPVSSTDLSKNTTVVYVDSNQTAKVSYVDQTTGTTLEDKELTGLPNSTSAYRTADTIKKYTDAGYELVKDNYPATGVQFGHDNQEQDYEVTLKHVEVPVSPEHSGQPGQAINPDNPNGPKWPAGTDVNSLQKNVRETINYVDESGKSVHTAATQNITFTRNASVDEVTGKVSYGGWNQNSASFSNEASPVVNGYVLKDHSQVMITGTKVTPESSDVNVDVVYTKLGSLVPTDSQGNIIDGGQYNTQYPNNQNNPSAINNPVLPEIPGKTPIDGQGHTLQPGNPYPVSSTDLSKNTTVVYVDSNQTAKVSYVDQTTGTTLEDKELTGLPNSTSAYRTADTIKKYTDAGYELVKDNYPATGVQFGHDNKEQDYEVTLKHVEVPVSPEHSGQPGQAINPDNPNGPKWPAGTDVNSLQKNVRETINYVDESGKSVHTAATQNITFTRNASVDEVTGKVSYGGWNQNSASFSNEASPVVNGYVLKDHSQVMITGTKVTPESSDVNVDVVYTKLGSLVPTDSQGNVIDGGQYNTQYPNNQNNPSAINNPVLPEIPGKTPIDGQGHTLQPGNPYPVSSTDLSKNTTVVYVDSNQTAKVSYVDQTTGTTLEDKELTGLPNSTSAYRTADTIKKYTDAGYELVKDNYPATGVQFGHDNKEQDYEVTLKHVEVPVSPEHSGQPGQAINPDNPNGPKWPAGTDVNSLQKNVRETINYVDESGKSVHTAATQNITFTRNASVDEVTGKVSYGGWNQNSASFSNEASPVVNGYVLKDHSQVMITGTKVTPESSDVNVDVVYTKLGSLVPTDSQGNIIDGGQYNTQYPNNQNNPSAINNPVLPEIPGKTPIDGQGHTLQPGNPYPVSSTDLSKNTTVVYVDSNQNKDGSSSMQNTNTINRQDKLPQTGQSNSENINTFGALFTIIGTLMAGFNILRKRKNK